MIHSNRFVAGSTLLAVCMVMLTTNSKVSAALVGFDFIGTPAQTNGNPKVGAVTDNLGGGVHGFTPWTPSEDVWFQELHWLFIGEKANRPLPITYDGPLDWAQVDSISIGIYSQNPGPLLPSSTVRPPGDLYEQTRLVGDVPRSIFGVNGNENSELMRWILEDGGIKLLAGHEYWFGATATMDTLDVGRTLIPVSDLLGGGSSAILTRADGTWAFIDDLTTGRYDRLAFRGMVEPVTSVPEPSSLFMGLAGLAALAIRSSRQKRG